MLASLILHNITMEPFRPFTYVFLIFHVVRTVSSYLVCSMEHGGVLRSLGHSLLINEQLQRKVLDNDRVFPSPLSQIC